MTGHGSSMPGIHLRATRPATVPSEQHPPRWATELRHPLAWHHPMAPFGSSEAVRLRLVLAFLLLSG